MDKKQLIIDYCRRFKLSSLVTELDPVLMEAQTEQMSYMDYTIKLLAIE